LEAAGLLRPHLPEAAGGAGAGWQEAYVVAHTAGRHAVPLPIGEALAAGWLLAKAGLEIPAGPLTLVPELLPAAALERDSTELTLLRVPFGRHAAHAAAVVAGSSGVSVVCLPLAGAAVEEGQNLALEPRDDLRVKVRGAPRNHAEVSADAGRLLGALVRSAQMAGALDAILDMAVQYAGERIQFGRPIGRFQAIQQELARLAGQVALAGTAAEMAARAMDEATSFHGAVGEAGDPAWEIACAKVVVGEAAELGPRIAHQVHGAIGFTYEHSLHFATRRLWAWRSEFGGSEEWSERLGATVLARGPDALWPLVTAR
jgi:acyl-CoA dehydrogenase